MREEICDSSQKFEVFDIDVQTVQENTLRLKVDKELFKVATPEKVLVDCLYLRPAKSKLFRALPERELPHGFGKLQSRKFAKTIKHVARRAMVEERLEAIIG